MIDLKVRCIMDRELAGFCGTAPIDESFLAEMDTILAPEIHRIKCAVNQLSYDTVYAPLLCPYDKDMRDQVQLLASRCIAVKPLLLVILGMGGSHLGIYAIYQALIASGKQKSFMPVRFVDTLDIDYVQLIIQEVVTILASGDRVLLVIVTKSGTTTETIANAHLFISIIRTYAFDTYQEQIVIITDIDSPLHTVALHSNIASISIPKMVGGRYSVMSAVGLFPLACMGISIDDVHKGARDAYSTFDNKESLSNSALLRAVTIAYYYGHHKVRIHDMFLWTSFLSGLGNWYRQLVAESLGKRSMGDSGELFGITPTVSVGQADLHSMVQLYLGGVHDKITTFVSVDQVDNDIAIPWYTPLAECGKDLQGKSYSMVAAAIKQGTLQAYLNDNRPYMEIVLPNYSAYTLGYVLQMLMVEVIYLGYIWKINPYNQPQVEQYKKITQSLLHEQ